MVACAALFVHLFQITKIPNGIHVDEMGMGYDAWCLAHFGVDRYLKAYPVYLMNFGGGQSALYAYLCIPFVKWFGKGAGWYGFDDGASCIYPVVSDWHGL